MNELTFEMSQRIMNEPGLIIRSEKDDERDRCYKRYIIKVNGESIATLGEDGATKIPEWFPQYTICEHCKKAIRKSNAKLVETKTGKATVCQWCLDNHTTGYTCAVCGLPIYSDEVRVDSKVYGPCCFKSMLDRGELVRCEKCSAIVEPGNIKIYHDVKMCASCYANERNVLKSYHTFKGSGNYKYYADPEGKLPMLGFELEVDGSSSCSAKTGSRLVADIFENVDYDFLKYETDGSLGSGGFEMISQPAYIGKHLELSDTYQTMMKALIDKGYSKHSGSAGLHVHIERTFFRDDSKIVNLGILMYRFHDEFKKFSRRTESSLGRWTNMPICLPSSMGQMNSGRYNAINLTNSKTVEIRLMRSTLIFSEFIATLKFISHFVVLANSITNAEANRISWNDVLGDDEDVRSYWNSL